MRWHDALARLEALLVEERAAIRRLDAATVLDLALEKEKLVDLLRRGPEVPQAPPVTAAPAAPWARRAGAPPPRAPAPPPRSPAPKLPTERLRRLGDDLRRNAVLLAHARDCIRDVVARDAALAAPAPAAHPGRQPSTPPGRRVSVTG
jgi:hypothetical protein